MKQAYYVTMTWDNWPEGGSYGTVVQAKDHDEAEKLARQEMAANRAETLELCEFCGEDGGESYDTGRFCQDCIDDHEGRLPIPDGAGIDSVLETDAEEWQLVDCFTLASFFDLHRDKLAGSEIARIGAVFSAGVSGMFEDDAFWSIYDVEGAKDFFEMIGYEPPKEAVTTVDDEEEDDEEEPA